MKKKVLYALLIILSICLIGCSKNNETETNQETKQAEQQETPKEPEKKVFHYFDLEQMKPNFGGEEYNKMVEIEMVFQGKVNAKYYGEYLKKPTTSAEDLAYATRVFNYCKSIAEDGKVYQSVGRFTKPNKADLKEVKSPQDAAKISNTYTWSIISNHRWNIISIAGDTGNSNSMGVRIVELGRVYQ
jgi:hypothetical protein